MLAAALLFAPGPSEADPPDPDSALAAFDAAWSVIHETHYDTTFGGVDWNAVREEFRPRVEVDPTPETARAAIDSMLTRLGRSHFLLLPSSVAESLSMDDAQDWDRSADPGIDVRFDGGEAVVVAVRAGSPAEAAGVRTGWTVRSVSGRPVSGVLETISSGLGRNRFELEAWLEVTALLAGPEDDPVTVAFGTAGAGDVSLDLDRERTPGRLVRYGNLPGFRTEFAHRAIRLPGGGGVGLIRFNNWMLPSSEGFDEAMDAHRAADGIVIDLRGNLGGAAAMLMGVGGHFFDEPVSLGTLLFRTTRLELKVNPRRVDTGGNRVVPYTGPVAVLVDELSVSASEFFAGGMQAVGRARVFGRRSWGGVLAASFTRLPNGDVLEHAIADFETPAGDRLEGRGVRPDLEVPLSREALLRGEDPVLDAALDWIEQETR